MNADAQSKSIFLYQCLLGGVKNEDSREFLDSLFQMVASIGVLTERQRKQLSTFRDPASVPLVALKALAALAGLDSTQKLYYFYTEDRWRRISENLISIWRSLNQRPGMEAVGVGTTSRPCVVSGYNDVKDVFDSGQAPVLGLGAPGEALDLRTIHVRVADDESSATKKAFAQAALSDIRPVNHQLRVNWLGLVENWTQGPFNWVDLAGTVEYGIYTYPDGEDPATGLPLFNRWAKFMERTTPGAGTHILSAGGNATEYTNTFIRTYLQCVPRYTAVSVGSASTTIWLVARANLSFTGYVYLQIIVAGSTTLSGPGEATLQFFNHASTAIGPSVTVPWGPTDSFEGLTGGYGVITDFNPSHPIHSIVLQVETLLGSGSTVTSFTAYLDGDEILKVHDTTTLISATGFTGIKVTHGVLGNAAFCTYYEVSEGPHTTATITG